MPECSIIIPVHNRASLTRQCLETLFHDSTTSVSFEVIVIDDASSDLTSAVLASYGDQIRVITHTMNMGFATSCNDGATAASGHYLVFLNNDTIPQPGWLDALVSYAACHPEAAVVGSKLLFPDDTIQHAGVVIGQDRWARHIYSGFPADHPAVNKSRRFQIVTAGCSLIRREPFEQVGGFDTTFMNGAEDVDLCLRLGERGYEVHYCHESVLYHLESVSINRESQQREFENNGRLYINRWGHRVQPDDLQYYLEDGLITIDYWVAYPIRLTVSPLLASVNRHDQHGELEQVLDLRAQQLWDLRRENILLGVRLQEAQMRADRQTIMTRKPECDTVERWTRNN